MPQPALSVPAKPPTVATWRQPTFRLQMLLGTLLGGGLMFFAARAVNSLAFWELIALCAALPVALWLHILVHEVGHAAAGLLSGHEVHAVGVGPIRLQREGDSWRVRWCTDTRAIAGFALMLPRSETPSRRSTTVYLLGGPLSNLFIAALALPWAWPDTGQSATIQHVIVKWFAGTGMLVGVGNLVPFLAGGWSSDGRQLLKLWQDADEARAMMLLRRLGALSGIGTRPRDWPMFSLQELRVDTLPQAIADALAQCLLSKAIDERQPLRPDAVAGATLLAGGFWTGQEAMRPMKALLLGRWLHEAGYEPALAQDWAELAKGGLVDQAAELAALRAMMALRRGDLPEAEKRYAEAVALRDRVQTGASLAMFDDDLAMLRTGLALSKAKS